MVLCHDFVSDWACYAVLEAVDDTCNLKKERKHVVTIDDYEDVPPNDEESLKKAVFNQPVSVAIEADQREFQLYAVCSQFQFTVV